MIDLKKYSQELDEHIEECVAAGKAVGWGDGGRGLFSFITPSGKWSGEYGCPSLIKGGLIDAFWPDLTEQIRQDDLIPKRNNLIKTRPQLERFKHYQMLRAERANAMEAAK